MDPGSDSSEDERPNRNTGEIKHSHPAFFDALAFTGASADGGFHQPFQVGKPLELPFLTRNSGGQCIGHQVGEYKHLECQTKDRVGDGGTSICQLSDSNAESCIDSAHNFPPVTLLLAFASHPLSSGSSCSRLSLMTLVGILQLQSHSTLHQCSTLFVAEAHVSVKLCQTCEKR